LLSKKMKPIWLAPPSSAAASASPVLRPHILMSRVMTGEVARNRRRVEAAGLLESDRLQRVAVALEPGLGLVGFRAEFAAQLPEARAVVHLLQMRHLMGD